MRPFKTRLRKDFSEKSEEQRHYEHAIRFHNWTLGITGAILLGLLTITGLFSYKDRKEFKDDVKDYIKESKEQIHEIVSSANTVSKESNQQSLNTLRNVKDDVGKSIQYIQENAKSLALSEATKQVNDAFREKNVQKSIQEAAEREITSSVRDMVFDKLKLLPNVMLALDRIRFGDKISFLYLDSLANYCKEPFIKSISDSIVKSKREEYDKGGSDEFQCLEDIRESDLLAAGFEIELAFRVLREESAKNKPDSSETYCRKLFKETMEDFNMNNNLNHLAYDFKVFRFLTGEKIKMFDFKRVKTLKYIEGIKHPYKCTGEGARRL